MGREFLDGGRKKRALRALLTTTALSTAALIASPALAQTSWDTVGGNGAVDGGTGTWDQVTTSNWTTNGGAANITWGAGDGVAVFGATAGTVTVSGAVTGVDTMTFNTTGYTVSGAGSLALTAGATITADVANTTISATMNAAGSLAIVSNGTMTLGGSVTTTTTFTTNAGGTTALSGATIAATTTATFNDAVTLTGANLVSGTAVTFASTVDGGGSLTVNSAGATTFTGAVGGTTALASLTTDAGGTTSVNGGSVTTTGAQTYNDAVSVGAGTTFTGNTISFNSTLNGAQAVVVTDAGTTTFGGAVGGVTALTSLTTTAGGSTVINGTAVTTTGLQDYNDAVTLGAATTLTSTGGAAINLDSTVDGTQTLNVNTTGATTFSGVVGGTTILTALTTNAGGTTAINTTGITTVGLQTYNDAVTLGVPATTLTGTAITFASTLDGANALTVTDAGATTFAGAVGGTTALTSLTTAAGGTTAINGGSVTTTGAQTYNDAVSLGAATVLTSTAGGVNATSSINNLGNLLTVSNAGAGIFSGAVVGAGGLTKTGAGNLTLSGVNTYTGTTTVNNGILTLMGGAAIIDAGVVNINAPGTLAVGASETVGTVTNGGTVSFQDGATGQVLTATTYVGGGTVAVDINLGPGGGTADRLMVTGVGGTSGATTVNFANVGAGAVLHPDILVIDTNGVAGGTTFTAGAGLPNAGLVQYSLVQVGSDWFVRSSANLAAVGGVAGNIAVVQGTLGAIVNRPSSPFVSGLASEVAPGYCGPGIWNRDIGGAVTASSTTSSMGSPDATATVGLKYIGTQFGMDIACFNIEDSGIDVSVGATAGYNQGMGTQDVPNGGTTSSSFNQGFGGLYATFAKGQFSADLQGRVDATHFVFNNPNIQLSNAPLDTLRTTLSGSASYAVPVGENMTFVPTGGFSFSRTTAGSVTFTTGQTLTPDPSLSLVGFVGATLATTIVQPDEVSAIQPFVTATVYNDFAPYPTAVFFDPATLASQTVTSTHLGAFGEISLGTNYFRIFDAEGGGLRQINATLRADARFSQTLLGAGLTAQVRGQY